MKKLLLLIPVLLLVSFKPKEKRHTIEITTDYGIIKLMLYNETPLHRDNMLKLVNEKFYDSTLFHRVIRDFMIQGGDPDSKKAAPDAMLGSGDIGYTIQAEFRPELVHKKGALAAARNNNPEKRSSGCQFYIVEGKTLTDSELDNIEKRTGTKYTPEQREAYKTIGGTPFLDQSYTVYGEVYEGLNVIDSISQVATAPGDRPLKDVRMFMKEGKMLKVK
ncbi:MAG: peptidylprolyl isomerase [Chitinophagales bacterium]|nr:peptidylprolyl isomerase [Chitinophagales bacterium]